MRATPPSRKITEVAAAVITRADGTFLLGRRPLGSVYAGYWEFPGGKIEEHEAPNDALVRELDEELGIETVRAYPWITREFIYPHVHVRLRFFRVVEWRGEIRDRIHSALAWQTATNSTVEPMLPANAPVLRALALPDFYAITHAAEIGLGLQLARIESALQHGLRMLQIREPSLDLPSLSEFASAAIVMARRYGARVLINRNVDLAKTLGADGVHLKAVQLAALERRPDLPLVAASVHDLQELSHAARLGLDFVALGPVSSTPTHPTRPAIGWESFSRLIENYPLPVYALGGLGLEDRERAWRHGAHGVAGIRAAWG